MSTVAVGATTEVVTGDAVVLDLRPARLPTRILGALIDLTICAAATLGWSWVVSQLGGSAARQQGVTVAGSIIITFGYPIATETITRGRTVGLLALGLRAVRDDGGTIRFRHALMRWLAFWVLDFGVFTGFCGGIVCAALNPQGKRFGDLIAGTMVIRTRSPRSPEPRGASPALAQWAGQVEFSRVGDELWNAVRLFVARAPGMNSYPRTSTADALANRLALRTSPAPPPGTAAEDMCVALVAERRRRESARLTPGGWVPDATELPAGWR